MDSDVPCDLRFVDRTLWKVIAGSFVKIPVVGSRVYYFPQGHSEQARSSPDFSSLRDVKPYYKCWISDVKLLADRETDDVYYKIVLVPVTSLSGSPSREQEPEMEASAESFSKTLTQSDANNGGGFSVPRYCADSIFPRLDYQADPPVQTIVAADVHGNRWEFRHIYRGTPRRHLLTTGWSKFVNSKKLIAGDSVVFTRNAVGEISIGVRRRRDGFRRNYRLRVSPESVVDAVRLAELNRPFEIVFYPMVSAEFVVRAEDVEKAMRVCWTSGIRVKMQWEADDSSRPPWHEGTVKCVKGQDACSRSCSPWRMLQVAWDSSELLHQKYISPWQVEASSAYPPTKKLRGPQDSELLSDEEGSMISYTSRSINQMRGDVTLPLLQYNSVPAGMQGARQDPFGVSNSFTMEPEETWRVCSVNSLGCKISPLENCVSTDLNICSSYHSESSSPPSHTSVLNCNSTEKSNGISFMLFGKTILTEQPADCNADTNYNEVKAVGETSNISL